MRLAEMPGGHPLETLLDQIYRVALAGQIENLAALVPRMEALLADFAGPVDQPLSDRLHQKAARNAICLQAAARGLRAARRRIAEIGAARDGLQTYDDRGRRAEVSHATGRLAQRI